MNMTGVSNFITAHQHIEGHFVTKMRRDEYTTENMD